MRVVRSGYECGDGTTSLIYAMLVRVPEAPGLVLLGVSYMCGKKPV